MKKYDTYKDSGIQWLGQIPEHWAMLKLRWICNQIFTGRTPVYSTEPNGLLVFGQRNNQKSGIDFTGIKYADEAFFASRSESEFLLFGDVLLNTLGGGSVGRIGFYDKTDQQVITDGHVMILRTNDTCTQRYIYYSLWAQQTKLEEAAVGSTNQAFLTTTQMTQWRIALPPLPEQQAIVEFLDKKTGQIDQSIALLETQKTDLQAYRQALITETVTKGLNPSAPMKDSGIQWIGEIPEHWKIKKSSYIFDIIGSGTTPKSDNTAYYIEDGEFWLQTGDLNDGLITNTTKRISSLAFQDYNLQKYPIGSIVIAMYGATIGKLGLLGISTATNQACCVLYADEKVQSNKYSFYLFSAAKREIINSANGGGQPNISQQIIRDFRLPTPPLSEQQAIADYLDKKTNDIDAALMQIDTQIADLQAYRTALISEVVTGKIDVRNQ